MKKFLASSLLSLAGLAFTAGASSGVSYCGWDFARAHNEGLPPTYCFERQAGGHQTFNGYLNLPCEGSSCPVPNNIFN